MTRDEEGQRLAQLDEPGVPDIVAFRKGLVTVDGATTEYTTDFARGGFVMGPEDDYGSRRRHQLGAKRSLAPSDEGPLGSSYSSSKAKAPRKATSRSPRASLAEQGGAANDDAADLAPVAAAPASTYTARVEHLTLMMYVGEPYKTGDPQPALWAAICVAAITVARLYGRGLLHRDISAGNILLARGASFIKTKNKWGALIDFDLARDVDAEPSLAPERTGTLSHIAWAIVAPLVDATPHYVWFDVGSIFWYLYVACLAADRPVDYGKLCWLAADGADEKKVTLYTQVRAYAAGHGGGSSRMGKSWRLLERFCAVSVARHGTDAARRRADVRHAARAARRPIGMGPAG